MYILVILQFNGIIGIFFWEIRINVNEDCEYNTQEGIFYFMSYLYYNGHDRNKTGIEANYSDYSHELKLDTYLYI